MARVRLSSRADRDLKIMADHIAQERPAAAIRFREAVVGRLRTLATWPRQGRLRPEFGVGVRSIPIGTVNAFYEVESEHEVTVLRIIDGRRDLGSAFFSPLVGAAPA